MATLPGGEGPPCLTTLRPLRSKRSVLPEDRDPSGFTLGLSQRWCQGRLVSEGRSPWRKGPRPSFWKPLPLLRAERRRVPTNKTKQSACVPQGTEPPPRRTGQEQECSGYQPQGEQAVLDKGASQIHNTPPRPHTLRPVISLLSLSLLPLATRPTHRERCLPQRLRSCTSCSSQNLPVVPMLDHRTARTILLDSAKKSADGTCLNCAPRVNR